MVVSLPIIDSRLSNLERQQKKLNNADNLHLYYEFMVSPTCPPSKILNIQSGMASSTTESYIQSQVADFEDYAYMGMTCNFTNAYYYLGIILCFEADWIQYHGNPAYEGVYWDTIFANVICDEVATAGEAEACIDSLMNGSEDWYYYRFPLWGVVLKNTGITGVDGEIQPIDKINRGRSYMYRDLRARTMFCD